MGISVCTLTSLSSLLKALASAAALSIACLVISDSVRSIATRIFLNILASLADPLRPTFVGKPARNPTARSSLPVALAVSLTNVAAKLSTTSPRPSDLFIPAACDAPAFVSGYSAS